MRSYDGFCTDKMFVRPHGGKRRGVSADVCTGLYVHFVRTFSTYVCGGAKAPRCGGETFLRFPPSPSRFEITETKIKNVFMLGCTSFSCRRPFYRRRRQIKLGALHMHRFLRPFYLSWSDNTRPACPGGIMRIHALF